MFLIASFARKVSQALTLWPLSQTAITQQESYRGNKQNRDIDSENLDRLDGTTVEHEEMTQVELLSARKICSCITWRNLSANGPVTAATSNAKSAQTQHEILSQRERVTLS